MFPSPQPPPSHQPVSILTAVTPPPSAPFPAAKNVGNPLRVKQYTHVPVDCQAQSLSARSAVLIVAPLSELATKAVCFSLSIALTVAASCLCVPSPLHYGQCCACRLWVWAGKVLWCC